MSIAKTSNPALTRVYLGQCLCVYPSMHIYTFTTMQPTTKFQIGDHVKSTRPADRGRPQGTVVEHDPETGRYRVRWAADKRTWMQAKALAKA